MSKSEESHRCEGKREKTGFLFISLNVLILFALVGAVCLAEGHLGTSWF